MKLLQSILVLLTLLVGDAYAAPMSRAEVVRLYDTMYVQARAVPSGWTGNVASCNAGTTSTAYRQAAIDVINYFRLLSGLPGNITHYSDEKVAQTQQAALMMAAQNSLSHSPAPGWACYSSGGATAAGKSNLALGRSGINAIELYMDDAGSGNYFVGHRRWILYPPQDRIASGSVPRANALWVIGGRGPRPATPDGVAWPPAGYVPYDLLPGRSHRWSFSYAGADFSAASVTMRTNGTTIPITLEAQLNNQGFADNTLVWRANGVNYNRPANGDETYSVTVANVRIGGTPRNFSYEVTVIDPDAVVIEPEQPVFSDSFE